MTLLGVRRLWFQVHKWLGIALCIVLIPLSLSGSVLLAHDWMEEVEGVSIAPPPLPLSRYVAAATPQLPEGARIASISFPSEEAPAVVVAAIKASADGAAPRGRPRPIRIALDPATAKPIPVGEDEEEFFEGTLHRFHGSLMIPVAGRSIVGWLGIAMLISSLTGLWLWWPTVGKWLRGLRWRRGSQFDFNLHHQVGFWIALPLALLSLSGAWISFPQFFSGLVGEPVARRMPPRSSLPLATPHLSPDAVAAQLATRGPVRRINFPTESSPQWVGQAGERGGIRIDDNMGAFVAQPARQQGAVMRWMREVHEGAENTGPVWRAIVVLGGIAPAALGITGITTWLRSRRWRGAVAERMARKAG